MAGGPHARNEALQRLDYRLHPSRWMADESLAPGEMNAGRNPESHCRARKDLGFSHPLGASVCPICSFQGWQELSVEPSSGSLFRVALPPVLGPHGLR